MDYADNLAMFHTRLSSRQLAAVARVTSCVLDELQHYANEAGFTQILPIMISPFTDPLNHAVYPAEIDYDGRRLTLTASMIFHKQLALNLENMTKIYIVSPNVRLEKASIKESSNHLIEFTQFDLEVREASVQDIMAFVDGLIRSVFRGVKSRCAVELSLLNRSLPNFEQQFPIYNSEELKERYGSDFEIMISRESPMPCFVTNFKREFYDRETPGTPGKYNNFDMIYPEGYGEGLSGAEREFDYDQIVRRMTELNMDLRPFESYLEASRRGHIPSSAGAGLGVQRLVKFICGLGEIRDVCLFDRSVGSEFLF